MKYVTRADGSDALLDDMPPAARAVLLLIEHANQRRDGGLPLPCPCSECEHHRRAVRCTSSADGRTLICGAHVIRPAIMAHAAEYLEIPADRVAVLCL